MNALREEKLRALGVLDDGPPSTQPGSGGETPLVRVFFFDSFSSHLRQVLSLLTFFVTNSLICRVLHNLPSIPYFHRHHSPGRL